MFFTVGPQQYYMRQPSLGWIHHVKFNGFLHRKKPTKRQEKAKILAPPMKKKENQLKEDITNGFFSLQKLPH